LSEAHAGPLAHHFRDLDQQKEAASLGMWVFIAQEVLFFGGLFGTYAIIATSTTTPLRGQPPPLLEPGWQHAGAHRQLHEAGVHRPRPGGGRSLVDPPPALGGVFLGRFEQRKIVLFGV
jgi:hypothetical protein